MTVVALDPTTAYPSAEALTLAPGPMHPERARYILLQTMPPGSGLEPAIDVVKTGLQQRFPAADVARRMRRDFMVDDPAERDALCLACDAAIIFTGPTASSVHVGWMYATALERAGLPATVVVFDAVASVAEHSAKVRGTALRHVVASHWSPGDRAWQSFAQEVIDSLVMPVPAPPAREATAQQHPDHTVFGDVEEFQRVFLERGWTDGLPVIPPTNQALSVMLRGTSLPPDCLVSHALRPEGLSTSVRHVALNAVMAGARAEHLPLILAAVHLFGDIELESMTRSVNSFAFSHLVSGPIAGRLGIVGGLNALGQGNWPNSAIARAIALTVRNCGGQRVGASATPAMGTAAGWSVFAENMAQSPWEPFHIGEGFEADDDTVSLFVGAFGIVGSFYYRGLDAAAELMRQFDNPTGALLLMTPKRARALVEQGYDRSAVTEYLRETATVRLGDFRSSGLFPLVRALIQRPASAGRAPLWPSDYLTRPDDDLVPIYPPSGVKLAVVGGEVASVMQLWNSIHHRTTSIAPWR